MTEVSELIELMDFANAQFDLLHDISPENPTAPFSLHEGVYREDEKATEIGEVNKLFIRRGVTIVTIRVFTALNGRKSLSVWLTKDDSGNLVFILKRSSRGEIRARKMKSGDWNVPFEKIQPELISQIWEILRSV